MRRINLLIVLAFITYPVISAKILHSERSLYRNIVVTENAGRRCMVFGRKSRNPSYQSCYYTSQPDQLVFSYTKYVLAGFSQIKQPPKKILIIGLGGGTLPMILEDLYPTSEIDSVEIDPAVVQVARDWFHYQSTERQRVHILDGRVFVKKQQSSNQRYDVVILDAFNGDYIPEHMMTREYFQEIKSILNPDGLLIANTFATNKLFDHESVTYQSVFGDFFHLDSDKSGNRIIYANLKSLNQYNNHAPVQKLKIELSRIGVNFQSFDRLISKELNWNPNAKPLTDQFSPANLLKID